MDRGFLLTTCMLYWSWFDSKNSREAFYLGRYVDEDLLNQKPSSVGHYQLISSTSSQVHLSYALGYSLLPALYALYFHHYALFVAAIHFLLQSSISTDELLAAEELL